MRMGDWTSKSEKLGNLVGHEVLKVILFKFKSLVVGGFRMEGKHVYPWLTDTMYHKNHVNIVRELSSKSKINKCFNNLK